jgi:CelD/BcsL family acetyltransferase involved in cellulose biosynthesis
VTLEVEQVGSPTWERLWRGTGREPFAHPEFGRIFAGAEQEAVAVCWEDDGGQVLLPLQLRGLPDHVASALGDDTWRDATSPYGYGGPFVGGEPDLAAFWGACLGWMREAQVLAGFVRGSVVGSAAAGPELVGVRSVPLSENVVVGLDSDPEERWRRYEHKVRKNVKKALRHGLTTVVTPTFTDVTGFTDVYAGTMDRRSAADFYRFDEAFFRQLAEALPDSHWVADTRDEDGVLVSTELVLVSDRHCYSFLGGTRKEAFSMSPNDLLKHAVIDHAAEAGLLGYVLGGGYAPGDGIFRYKKAFDPTGVVPFNGIQVVADQQTYDAACLAVDAPDGSFFPRYRTPA